MRVMVMIQGDGVDEDKIAPTEAMMAEMTTYNEQLVSAGIMLDGEGLRPTSDGARIVWQGGTTSVVDGPFVESKEIIAGYWLWEVSSLEEAIEWAKRCPSPPADATGRQLLEIRPIYDMNDVDPDVYTPELREREEQLNERIREQHPTS
ncbi:YciI family protein [Aldersonia kunmingensis]|uniref:YciI family protein n=1 Tax=Aldersonia kunmingensis TaxID=408066 RepID=UPI00083406B7|nr:YciI family protein [Aldersonia kunmingensis]